MAQRMSVYEQEAASRQQVQQQQQQQRQPIRGNTCMSRALPLIFLACIIIIPLLFILNVFANNDVPFLGDVMALDCLIWTKISSTLTWAIVWIIPTIPVPTRTQTNPILYFSPNCMEDATVPTEPPLRRTVSWP